MKIVLVVHQFAPEFFMGTETLVMSVAQRYRARGHEVLVFSATPEMRPAHQSTGTDSYEVENLRVLRLMSGASAVAPPITGVERAYWNPDATHQFATVLDRHRPEIVHFFHFARMGVGLIDAAVERRIAVYFTPTDFWFACPTQRMNLEDGTICRGPSEHAGNCIKHIAMTSRNPSIKRTATIVPQIVFEGFGRASVVPAMSGIAAAQKIAAVARRRSVIQGSLKRITRAFAPTATMVPMLLEYGLESAQVVEVPYGVDLGANRSSAPRERVAGRFTVGFIGTLTDHKGCRVLVDAVRGMNQAGLEVRIFGRGSDDVAYYEGLRAAAADVPSIRFMGTFERSEIGRVLADLDTLVVPSLWRENMPLVVLAALKARRPVIGSDVPGISAVIHEGRNGLLVLPGDSRALREAIERLRESPALYAELAANSTPIKSSAEYADALLSHYARDVPVREMASRAETV